MNSVLRLPLKVLFLLTLSLYGALCFAQIPGEIRTCTQATSSTTVSQSAQTLANQLKVLETKMGSSTTPLPNQPPVVIRQEDLTHLKTGEVRTTSLRSGLFRRTIPNKAKWTQILNHPLAQTGGTNAQVWQGPGPNGLIWGPRVMENGQIKLLPQRDASQYCINLNYDQKGAIRKDLEEGYVPLSGCFLPREADFVEKRESMGARPRTQRYAVPKGYKPQIFSDLDSAEWSSSDYPDDSSYALSYNDKNGQVSGWARDLRGAFRCVCRVPAGKE